tara:strand:- start:4341 stop:5033 length:693 start_codon:yes stop_codon:yes gene_type:complete
MKYELFSFHFAEEILKTKSNGQAFEEIIETVKYCPTFIWPNKSKRNKNLKIVQQLLNTYFDRKLVIDYEWDYQPKATKIKDSNLKADFRKTFNDKFSVQVEVQFGNMSRWYSDLFKFQAAYSQNLADIAISILPMSSMANQIDSNVANFERACRELPAAKESITLPILLIGIESNKNEIDVSMSGFNTLNELIGKNKKDNQRRLVNGLIENNKLNQINESSSIGPVPENM